MSGVRERPNPVVGGPEGETLTVAVEATLHHRDAPDTWSAFMKPGKRIRPGDRIVFDSLSATVVAKSEDGLITLRFDVTGPALDEASSAAKLDPENPQAYNLLGLINMQIKEDALATLNFERALRLAGTDPDINNNYGWFLCERGRHAESIRFFMAAVRSPLYANVDRSLVNAGVCSRRRGDNAEAMRFFEQALGLRSNQPVALFNLADLSFASGRAQEARVFLNRLMQAAAPTAEVLWLGVRIERALDDRQAEALYAQQLRRLFPGAPETQLLTQQGGR